MSERKDPTLEFDDAEFERLFSALDEVHASEDLTSATLARLFALADEEAAEGGEDGRGEPVEEPAAEPRASEDEDRAPHLRLVSDERETSPARPRKRRNWLKSAAAAVVLVACLGGGVAYAVPASHVVVSVDDTTFDLGVNVYGITISATSSSDDGREAIDKAEVHNRRFEDSLNNLLDRFDEERGEVPEAIDVQVKGGFAGGDEDLSERAQRIAEKREASAPQGDLVPQTATPQTAAPQTSTPQTESSDAAPAAEAAPAPETDQQPDQQPGQEPSQQPDQQPSQQPDQQPAAQDGGGEPAPEGGPSEPFEQR